ncbi:MAG: hypothetical protein AAF632_10235 [Bacteroidota bacterium]
MHDEIKKLRQSVALVDTKLSFMHEQFGDLKNLFKDVGTDIDNLVDLVADHEERFAED